MAESDEKIEKLLSELPDNLDGVSFLSEKYSELAGYGIEGALSSRVSEALKRIRDFAEVKLNSFDAENITPEGAVFYQGCLDISLKTEERTEETQKRNAEVFAAIAPKLEEFDKENNIPDIDENTDIAANSEAWEKVGESIHPFEEVMREDGGKSYRITKGFEGLGGFFAALDKESGNEISEMARLEAIQNLSVNAPSEDAEANRQAFIEEFNGILDQTGFHLWQEYQKQTFAEEHPELLSGFDFEAAMQIEPQLDNPKEHVTALSEEEVKNADNRIRQGESLSLTEMAGMCKARDLLNKPARAELMSVIERAAAAEKIEGSDLVALQYLLDEVERVPEYKSLAKEETLSAARRHPRGFRGNLGTFRQFQQTLQQQTVEFERNSFSNKKVLKSSLAAVIAARSAAMAGKAERLSFKTKAKAVWGKIRAWDDKVTKKYPKLYPMAKGMAISTGIGATVGVAGLLAYSGAKLYKEVKKNYNKYKEEAAKAKAEGREFYKNYRSYFCAKENRKEAYQIGGAAVLSLVSAGFGVHAAMEHGLSAVTGLSGQVAQHGFSGLSFGGGAVLDNIKDVVANPSWEKVGTLAKSAVVSVATNSRVIASTGTSLFTGMMVSREVAKEQRAAEEQLDALLKQYGVSELPSDKKLLKMRSSDPAAYALAVLKQNTIALNSEQLKTLNSITKTIDAKRKDKNMRRWGAIGGSALGLAFAGMFGAKPEDLQTNTPEIAPETSLQELNGIAAESHDYANLFGAENNDDLLVSDKLNSFGNNRFGLNIFGDNGDMQADSAQIGTEEMSPRDAALASMDGGIDIQNLSSEQQHDLDMLFKRYPRAASLILEGNDNPSVTDSPSNGVVSSAKLQAMYESGNIPADKLEDMVKFAGEHFDAKGNFVGSDAEALNAEAENWSRSHTNTHSGNGSGDKTTELSDNENADNGNQNEQTEDERQGNKGKSAEDDIDADLPDDDSGDSSSDENNNEDENAAEPVVATPEYELTGKGVHLTYHIEPSDNEHGYELVRDGDAKYDKEMFKQLNKDIVYQDGEYVAANGHIHHSDPQIVRERVKLLCTEVTKENYIAADIAARGNPTEAEQAFLNRHESHLQEYGVTKQTESLYANFESKTLSTAADNQVVPENVAENKAPENTPESTRADSDETSKGNETPVVDRTVSHEIHQKGVNISYSIEDGANGNGFRLRYDGTAAPDPQMLKEMRDGITLKDGVYSTANGAISSKSLNIVNSKISMVCQQATVQNAIAENLRSSGAELSSAEQAFLKSHENMLARYGIEHTSQSAVQMDVHVTDAHAVTSHTTPESEGWWESPKVRSPFTVYNGLTENEGGMLTTQSGYSFKIDAKGDVVHQSVLSAEAQAKAEAEIFAALRSSYNLKQSELVFVNDYARDHNINLHAAANATLMAQNSAASTAHTSGQDDVQQPVIQKSGGGRTTTRDPWNNDDIYYRPEKASTGAAVAGTAGVAAASRDVATPVGDGQLEDSRQEDTSTPIAHESEIGAPHRIWQYKGIKGHYNFVSNGENMPTVNITHLNNIPEQLNLREHIRATHEWNGNATYEEYLGGAIRGTPNEVNAQFQTFCKNLEGSDVVYRDMQHQIAKGYQPTVVEQKWMQGFERDLRTMGLDYVDGKLTAVQSPQCLKAQWYGTSDNIKTSQILQCRSQQYNR